MDTNSDNFEIQTQEKLIHIIKQMSFDNQLALLEYLQKDKQTDRRKYPRKKCFLEVNYATPKVCDSNYMRDISEGGMFVKTDKKVTIGDEIIMSFSFPGKQYIIKAVGQVVRIEEEGVGIEFQQEMIRDLQKITNFINAL